VGMPWAKTVPVRGALVVGRKAMEKVQDADGARVMQVEGVASGNWRGRLRVMARVSVVRLLTVNRRVLPRVPVGAEPKLTWVGRIWRPASAAV